MLSRVWFFAAISNETFSQAPDLPTREDSFCSIHCFLMSCGPSEVLMTDKDDLQYCCRKGDPPWGPHERALVQHSEMNCPRRHMCWQSKRFYWERAPGWRAGGWGYPGELLCHVACSLWFYCDGISFQVVFGQSFWLSPSWWHRHCSAKMDASERDSGKWTDTWCLLLASPELFWLLWLILCSLPGPPVVKQLMQMVTREPGQGGQFVSVLPLTVSSLSFLN